MLENLKNLYFSVSFLQKQFYLCLIKQCSWAVRVLFVCSVLRKKKGETKHLITVNVATEYESTLYIGDGL